MTSEELDLSDFASKYEYFNEAELENEIQILELLIDSVVYIKDLQIQQCNLTNKCLETICGLLGNVQIAKLNVTGNDFGPQGMVHLAKLVQESNVEVLVVRACFLQSVHLEKFMENVGNAKLTEVDLSWNIITESMIQQIMTMVHTSEIKVLTLIGCNLGDQHLTELLQNAPGKIEELDISDNSLGLDGMTSIARFVEICEVERLIMQTCDLEPQHLKIFFQNLGNARLDEMNVSSNNIGKSGLAELSNAMDNDIVKTIAFKDCNVSFEEEPIKVEKKEKGFFECIWKLAKMGNTAVKNICADFLQINQVGRTRNVKWVEIRRTFVDSDISLVVNNKKAIEAAESDEKPDESHSSATGEVVVNETVPKSPIEYAAFEVDPTAAIENIVVAPSTRALYEAHVNNIGIYQYRPNRVKGKVLIINNEFTGRGEHERFGSNVDVLNQSNLWISVGFTVEIKHNLSADLMLLSCMQFAEDCHNANVIVLIIMTHGGCRDGEEVLSGEDGKHVKTDDIISCFSSTNSPHIQGIPKVLMFQACRGRRDDFGGTFQPIQVKDARPEGNMAPRAVRIVPQRADMLLVRPSQLGYAAFRDRLDGSWLMNTTANVFMAKAHNTSVLEMLIEVNRKVAEKSTPDGRVQMCLQETTLTKKLFLYPGWPDV